LPPPTGSTEKRLAFNEEEKTMAKAYWIARVDVRDAERYKDYVSTAKPAFERYGAKFLVRATSLSSFLPWPTRRRAMKARNIRQP
jgi:hypothetical protein